MSRDSLAGLLYVVATPIGNLQDCSPRAVETLKKVSLIAAEDTRHSRRLLDQFGIQTPLQALHEHNEQQISSALLKKLAAGENIAVISDAGTPLISDPGFRLVQACHQAGITVTPIPGPSALICALSAAGMPADKFIFEGFLPSKPSSRAKHLQTLAEETRTLVFYEAPHRILESVSDLAEAFGGEREVVLARELTKVYETIHHSTLSALLAWMQADHNQQKGEFVLIVAGAPPVDNQEISSEALQVFHILREELPLKQAAKLASRITGVNKNRLYALGLEQEGEK